MRKTMAHFSTRALMTCGLVALGFQVSAQAATIDVSLSPDPVAGTTHQSTTVTIQVDAIADMSGDALGVTVSFDVPKGLSVSAPANCIVSRAQGSSSVVCSLGDIAEGTSKTVDIDFSANKAASWGLDVQAGCTTSFCLGTLQDGVVVTFSH